MMMNQEMIGRINQIVEDMGLTWDYDYVGVHVAQPVFQLPVPENALRAQAMLELVPCSPGIGVLIVPPLQQHREHRAQRVRVLLIVPCPGQNIRLGKIVHHVRVFVCDGVKHPGRGRLRHGPPEQHPLDAVVPHTQQHGLPPPGPALPAASRTAVPDVPRPRPQPFRCLPRVILKFRGQRRSLSRIRPVSRQESSIRPPVRSGFSPLSRFLLLCHIFAPFTLVTTIIPHPHPICILYIVFYSIVKLFNYFMLCFFTERSGSKKYQKNIKKTAKTS